MLKTILLGKVAFFSSQWSHTEAIRLGRLSNRNALFKYPNSEIARNFNFDLNILLPTSAFLLYLVPDPLPSLSQPNENHILRFKCFAKLA